MDEAVYDLALDEAAAPSMPPPPFHDAVVAHEEHHPLRGWGTDVALIIVSHLDPRSALYLSMTCRNLHETSRTEPRWPCLAEAQGDAAMAADEAAENRRAVSLFTHAATHRATVPVLIKLSTAHLRVEEAQSALAAAERALQLDPTAHAAHLAHSFALRMNGQTPFADAAWQQAIAHGAILNFAADTSITCSYQQKETAKTAGARWQPTHRTWYARSGRSMLRFYKPSGERRWQPWGAVDLQGPPNPAPPQWDVLDV